MSEINVPKATVYGQPGCFQCKTAVRHLEAKNIPYVYEDVTENEAAMKWVQEMGYQGVPVVSIGFEHTQGFNPDWINEKYAAAIA